MSNKIMEMTDDELVSHYRDMQCLSVDTSTKEGLDNLRYYQGIVRQMARRFAILVENREIEDEPKTGHWIHGAYCSKCGCDIPAYIIDWKWQKDMDAKYCPNCGARMVEPQESEDKG